MDEERYEDIDALARARGVDPDELRREVSRFRLALDADLTVAAAAVAEGEPAIARSVVGADAAAVGPLEQRLLTGVRSALPPRHRRPVRSARRLAAVAFAAGLFGAAGGAAVAAVAVQQNNAPATAPPAPVSAPPARATTTTPQDPARVLAEGQAQLLSYAVANRLPADTISAAAGALRASLLPLVSAAQDDPALAGALAGLLKGEQQALAAVPAPNAQIAAAMAGADTLLGQLPAGTTPTPSFPAPAGSGTAVVLPSATLPPVFPTLTPPASPSARPLPSATRPPAGPSVTPGGTPAANLP